VAACVCALSYLCFNYLGIILEMPLFLKILYIFIVVNFYTILHAF